MFGDFLEGCHILQRDKVLGGIGAAAFDGVGDQLDGLAFGLGDQQFGLGFTFGAGDLGLLLAVRHADLVFAFGVTGEHLGAFVAFGAHFLFHGGADLFRGQDLLQFHTVDLDAPLVGGFVQDVAQFGVDGVARSEGEIQGQFADHVTQRGLGEFLDRLGQVADLIHGLVGVGDLEIEQGVDVDGDVVAGDHVLAGEVVDRLAQVDAVFHALHHDGVAAVVRFVVTPVDGAHLVENGHDDVNAGGEGLEISSQTLHDHHFGLPHDDDPARNQHDHKECKSESDKGSDSHNPTP